jgi:hypothetical protein
MNPIQQAVTKRVGSGNSTKFWKEVWLGNQSLEARFSRLFGISTQKEALVSEVAYWENGVWRWGLMWRRNFFVWEEELVDELMVVLNLASITTTEDKSLWNPGGEEGFSVKSTYVFLDHILNPYQQLPSLLLFAFKFIWKCGVPSKVSAFAWQLLLDRLPTRDNLRRRGVVNVEGSRCPYCLAEVESATHLFLHCRLAAGI